MDEIFIFDILPGFYAERGVGWLVGWLVVRVYLGWG